MTLLPAQNGHSSPTTMIACPTNISEVSSALCLLAADHTSYVELVLNWSVPGKPPLRMVGPYFWSTLVCGVISSANGKGQRAFKPGLIIYHPLFFFFFVRSMFCLVDRYGFTRYR